MLQQLQLLTHSELTETTLTTLLVVLTTYLLFADSEVMQYNQMANCKGLYTSVPFTFKCFMHN